MLKALAATLGLATLLLAGSIFAQAAETVIFKSPPIDRTIKEDRADLLLPVPNTPEKRDRESM